MLPLSGLSPVSGKSVIAKFDGGLLSSDGGVLMLREVEQRLRVADHLAGCIEDPIGHAHLADNIRFRLLMIAADGKTPKVFASIRCSGWRMTFLSRTANCVCNRSSRGWRTYRMAALCCAWPTARARRLPQISSGCFCMPAFAV
jgi:hypothetical protein